MLTVRPRTLEMKERSPFALNGLPVADFESLPVAKLGLDLIWGGGASS